jgi:hypothetical protein
MPRRYSDRRRRRPGRSPPRRYTGGPGPSRPQGFTPAGYRVLYDLMLPTLQGREMRLFFNKVSGGMVLGFGLGGALAGFAWAGLVGAVVGLAVGLGLGGSFAERHRFYRR